MIGRIEEGSGESGPAPPLKVVGDGARQGAAHPWAGAAGDGVAGGALEGVGGGGDPVGAVGRDGAGGARGAGGRHLG